MESPIRTSTCISFPPGPGERLISTAPKARFRKSTYAAAPSTLRCGVSEWNPDGIGLAAFDMGTGYQLRYSLPMRSALFFVLATLHAQTIGMDTHIDTAQRVLIDRADITQRSPVGHVDIPRLKEGGVNAPFFALWVPTYYQGAE